MKNCPVTGKPCEYREMRSSGGHEYRFFCIHCLNVRKVKA